jgi:hypothetical protein
MSGDNKTAIIIIALIAFAAIVCTYVYGNFSCKKEIELTKQLELSVKSSKDRTLQTMYMWKSDSINSLPVQIDTTDNDK